MTRPPTIINGKEANRPNIAEVNAGMISRVSAVTESPAIGAIRMPATAASIEPRTQLTVASRYGEIPSARAASEFSATAAVLIPKFVVR